MSQNNENDTPIPSCAPALKRETIQDSLSLPVDSHPIIKNSYIQLHRQQAEAPPAPIAGFGLLTIELAEMSPQATHHHIMFSADTSASMAELCKDRQTKMYHLKLALKNLLKYCIEFTTTHPTVTISVHIDTFNDEITPIATTQVNIDTMNYLIDCLMDLTPSGSTNIEMALKNARKVGNEYLESHLKHTFTHIMMTDGEANIGQSSKTKLAEEIDESFPNIMVGFGIDHDSALLHTLASKKHGEYHFIDDVEKGGLVYGVIAHNIFYTVATNVEIIMNPNTVIYDWKENKWSNTLLVSSFTSETVMNYHIKTNALNEDDSPTAIIFGYLQDDTYPHAQHQQQQEYVETFEFTPTNKGLSYLDYVTTLPYLKYEDETIYPNDLTRYIFRQRVMELLYEVRTLSIRSHSRTSPLKTQIKTLFKELRAYIKDKSLESDSFMKVLCDDLYVAYKTFGTEHAHMYTCARQNSQGSQGAYTVNIDSLPHCNSRSSSRNDSQSYDDDCDDDNETTSIFTLPPPQLRRQNTVGGRAVLPGRSASAAPSATPRANARQLEDEDDFYHLSDSDDDNIFEGYVMTHNTDTPYTTPNRLNAMRTVSGL